ncbi:hypothetical protein C0J52_27385 [Blattella germanica]|nr:hypothetical protein C0J52_27385 [Blattella germanica]
MLYFQHFYQREDIFFCVTRSLVHKNLLCFHVASNAGFRARFLPKGELAKGDSVRGNCRLLLKPVLQDDVKGRRAHHGGYGGVATPRRKSPVANIRKKANWKEQSSRPLEARYRILDTEVESLPSKFVQYGCTGDTKHHEPSFHNVIAIISKHASHDGRREDEQKVQCSAVQRV